MKITARWHPARGLDLRVVRCLTSAAKEHVVDANAVVAIPRPGLVIPEGVVARPLGAGAECLGQPEIQQPAKGGAALGQGERVRAPIPKRWSTIASAGRTRSAAGFHSTPS